MPEFLEHDLPDFLERHGRRRVLQFCQLRRIFRGHEVGSGAEGLAELNERGAKFAEGHPQVFGLCVWSDAGGVTQPPALKRDEVAQPDLRDQPAQPMPGQRRGDLA